jgi:dTDP-4-dehydrorhamnose reductase
MKNIGILGPNGYIGSEFVVDGCVPLYADICHPKDVYRDIVRSGVKAVINCAGVVGNKVDDLEVEPFRSEAMIVNGDAVRGLTNVCHAAAVSLIHLSSGCIFMDGPESEGDTFDNTNCYTLSKIGGEVFAGDSLILRFRQPFDGRLNPRNLIHKVDQMGACVIDEQSMCYVPDLLHAAYTLMGNTGVYHVASDGVASPYQIATMLGRKVTQISNEDLYKSGLVKLPRSKAKLITDKAKAAGCQFTDVTLALARSVGEYAIHKNQERKG